MRASKLRRGLLTLLAVVLALAWAFPVYWMVNSAFLDKVTLQSTKPTFLPFGGSLDNFTTVLGDPAFGRALAISLSVTLVTVAAALAIAFLGALAISRFRFRGRASFVLALLLIQMLPAEGLFIAQYTATPRPERLTTESVTQRSAEPVTVSRTSAAVSASNERVVPPTAAPSRVGSGRLGLTPRQWVGAGIVVAFAVVGAVGSLVLLVRWFLGLGFMQDFLLAYPGEYPAPEGTPVGVPAWLSWQHFFNVFLIVLIIRSGLQVRMNERPSAYWTPRWSKGGRGKISLSLWFHQSLDILWVLNGAVFVVLLFATGQWMKIVPTSWEVFPNAASAMLQYISLDWPTENGWVNYNGLQQLAYFTTVFIASPLAMVTGVRMSGAWPKNAPRLTRLFPIERARAAHFPVMVYFVLFIITHVALVFATGALRNLNHMYAGQDVENWTGFWIFAGSLVIIVLGWLGARPLMLAPIARLFGKVSAR